jgi:hypothetical protein
MGSHCKRQGWESLRFSQSLVGLIQEHEIKEKVTTLRNELTGEVQLQLGLESAITGNFGGKDSISIVLSWDSWISCPTSALKLRVVLSTSCRPLSLLGNIGAERDRKFNRTQ